MRRPGLTAVWAGFELSEQEVEAWGCVHTGRVSCNKITCRVKGKTQRLVAQQFLGFQTKSLSTLPREKSRRLKLESESLDDITSHLVVRDNQSVLTRDVPGCVLCKTVCGARNFTMEKTRY